jgi:hypothetical protein
VRQLQITSNKNISAQIVIIATIGMQVVMEQAEK